MYPYPPHVAEVSITASADKVNQICNALEGVILSVTQTLEPGVAAWRIYENISIGANYDKVFFSSGSTAPQSGGNGKIFFRLQRASSILLALRSYSDWSIVSHTGSGESQQTTITLHDSIASYFYFNGNEHGVCCALSQSTTWFFIYGGETIREFCNPRMGGRAYLLTGSASGSNITFGLDRDLSPSVLTGSQGYIIAQTPSGSVLKGNAWSISQITAVNGNQITMANTYFTHSAGDLFGVFPQTNIVGTLSGTGTPTFQHGLSSGGSASTAIFDNIPRTPMQAYEDANDPNVYRRFEAMYWGVKDADATNILERSWWGCLHHVLLATSDGNYSTNDRVRLNFDNNKIYQPFPGLSHSGFILLLKNTSSVV